MMRTGRLQGRLLGFVLIVTGSTFAGSLGIFYRLINERYQASSETMVFSRTVISLAVLLIALLGWQRKQVRLDRHTLPWLIAFGVLGQAFYSWIYARSMLVVGVSITAVMVQTGPLWITLFEWLALRRPPGMPKVAAMALMLAGVALVARVFQGGGAALGPLGLALSLGASVAGALWAVLNREASRHSNPSLTVTFGQLTGALVLGATLRPAQVIAFVAAPGAIWWLLALGLGPALLGPLLWTQGLRHLPASDACIVGAWEPFMACMLAFLVLGERLDALQVAGGVAIVASIVLLAAGERASAARRAASG